MSSILGKLRIILEEEDTASSEISRGDQESAKRDLDVIEDQIVSVLESERQDLEQINQTIKNLRNWEKESHEIISKSVEDFELVKAGLREQNRSKLLKNTAKINRRLFKNRDRVEPESTLSESQLEYFKEINAIGKSLEAVENLNQIIQRLESNDLDTREKKIGTLSESLEAVIDKRDNLESSETAYQDLYQELNDLINEISSVSFLTEREVKAVKTTLKNLSEMVRDVGKVESEGTNISRRDFLKIASTSFIGLAAASQIYEDFKTDSNSSISEENLNRTERFLYEYFREINSWSSEKLQLGNHVVIAENHNNMDAYVSLADFISIHDPDAVGLEFFYRGDIYLKEFNNGNVETSEVIDHWNNHIARGRPEKVQKEILSICRKNNIDLIGLEPVKQTFYPDNGKDVSYKERSLGMSEIAAETAKKYDKTAFIVGYLHSGLPLMIPEMLLRSAKPRFKGKFNLEDFHQNPLRFTEYEKTKHAHLFHKNPGLRINHRLKKNNFDVGLLKATSAEEQMRTFNEEYSNLGQTTEKTELIREKVQKSIQKLEKAQPASFRSRSNYDIMLREPYYD